MWVEFVVGSRPCLACKQAHLVCYSREYLGGERRQDTCANNTLSEPARRLVLAPRTFSSSTPVLPSPQKSQHFQIPIRSGTRGPQVCQSQTVRCYSR